MLHPVWRDTYRQQIDSYFFFSGKKEEKVDCVIQINQLQTFTFTLENNEQYLCVIWFLKIFWRVQSKSVTEGSILMNVLNGCLSIFALRSTSDQSASWEDAKYIDGFVSIKKKGNVTWWLTAAIVSIFMYSVTCHVSYWRKAWTGSCHSTFMYRIEREKKVVLSALGIWYAFNTETFYIGGERLFSDIGNVTMVNTNVFLLRFRYANHTHL